MKRSLREMEKKFRVYVWGDKGLTAILILFLLSAFIAPLINFNFARILIGLLFSALLLSGVSSVSVRLLPRAAAGLLVGTTIVTHWLHDIYVFPILDFCAVFLSLLCFLLLTVVILKQVFQDGAVTVAKIKGAVAVYILIGFSWSYIYQLIVLRVPEAFNLPHLLTNPGDIRHSADLTYFSFVTLTTLGYGDITAAHPISRMFVIIEALIGQLYPATLLARLVSLEIVHREKHQAGKKTDKVP